MHIRFSLTTPKNDLKKCILPLILLIATLLPMQSHAMSTLPKAINTQHVKQFYETQVERDPKTGIIKGAEPFYYEGTNKTAILLIHGLTGSPFEMKGLGKYLNSKGYTAQGILLSGHGTSPIDLEKRKWLEWIRQVEGALYALKEHHDRVIVCGLCMGSSLGAAVSTRNGVDGLILLSPILFLRDAARQPLLLPTKLFWSYFEYDKGKPLARPQAYKFLPLKSLSQMLALNQFTRGELAKITAPTLIIASHNDPVPDPKTFPYIMNHIGSAEKRLVMLDKSGHVVTEDVEKEIVFRDIFEFITPP